MFRFRIDDDTELRVLEGRHAEELFALTEQNRAYLREWLPWLDNTGSLEDTQKFIKRSLEQFANNNGFQAGIWYQGKLVGVIGYHKIDWANRKTSIGYWLGASFQGRGLVTKACRGLVDYAFNELGLNRVEIHCATENKKSCAIPERLGFTQEGTIRQAERLYDHFVDHVVYRMLADEWAGV
ncbi:MAG: GNAT family N-acetyltransferase [Candidatus Bipolaricaulia bacterium]